MGAWADEPDQSVELYVASGIHHSARTVALSPDGALLAASGLDRTVKLWDASTRRELTKLPNVHMAVSLAFLPDRPAIAAANENGGVKIWDYAEKKLIIELACSEFGWEASLAIDQENEALICLDPYSSRLNRWSLKNFTEMPAIPLALSGTEKAKALLTPNLVAASTERGEIYIHDIETGGRMRIFSSIDLDSMASIAYAPEAGLMAIADPFGSIETYAWRTGRTDTRWKDKHNADGIHDIAISADERRIVYATESGDIGLLSFPELTLEGLIKSVSNRIEAAGMPPNASQLVVKVWYDTVLALDLSHGRLAEDAPQEFIRFGANRIDDLGSFEGRWFLVRNNGDHLVLETEEGETICTIVFRDKLGQWVVIAPDGRFDTNMDLSVVDGAHWILGGEVLAPLPLEILMRSYYSPGLLPMLLLETEFPALPNISDLNRIQPGVRIVDVRRGPSADVALVDVEVSEVEDLLQPNGKVRTGVYDVRLFRNGQLVGQWPEPREGAFDDDLEAWRLVSQVEMPSGETNARHTFEVRLASRDTGEPVAFTAYAFNEDRVKSATATDDSYPVPEDIAPRPPRAYVIAVGVNEYENPRRRLSFAVADAEAMTAALQEIEGYEVFSLSLISDYARDDAVAVDQATKANIRVVLSLLAGDDSERVRLRREFGADVDNLAKATPDDLVILTFSGHGYTERGRFYMLPSDSGDGGITEAVLPKLISSEELTEWLREVDAGELVMIIDACHSAAGIPEGFKPGPMGDRGLGQLAYDKGMRILAATQAEDVALESGELGKGLLTYALVEEGLKPGLEGKPEADNNDDGAVTMKEWLSYAEIRVPGLYEEIRDGTLELKDAVINTDLITDKTRHAQTPALFDFAAQEKEVFLNW